MLIRPCCRVIANMGGEIRVQRLAPPLAVCLWTNYLIPFNFFLIFEMEKFSAIGLIYPGSIHVVGIQLDARETTVNKEA